MGLGEVTADGVPREKSEEGMIPKSGAEWLMFGGLVFLAVLAWIVTIAAHEL